MVVGHDGITIPRPAEHKDNGQEDTNTYAHGHALVNYFIHRVMLTATAILVLRVVVRGDDIVGYMREVR
jgi:hypothetical protein